MPISDHLNSLIEHAFGEGTARRGFQYYRQDRVDVLGVDTSSPLVVIEALIHGGHPEPYQTRLFIDPELPEELHGICDCPMVQDCKHCAALAYTYYDSQSQSRAEAEIQAWLAQISQQQAQSVPNPDMDLVIYLLSLPVRSLEPEVRLLRTRPLKSGGLAKGSRVTLESLAEPFSGISAADQEIAGLLLSSRMERYSDEPVPAVIPGGRGGKLALEQMLASGRCHLDHKDGLHLQLGDARQLELFWKQGPKGWQIEIRTEPAFTRMFQLDGFWYFDSKSHTIGSLTSELPNDLLASLIHAPAIPQAMLERVTRRLVELLPHVPLPLPEGLEIEIEDIRDSVPVPHLTLRSQQVPSEGAVYMQHLVQLEFAYEDVYISPTAASAFVQLEQDGQIYRLRRDLPCESQHQLVLTESGLQALPQGLLAESGAFYDLPGLDDLAQAQSWDRWLRDVLPGLEDSGWEIHIASDFALGIYESSDWQASLTATDDEQRWFDLSMGIELEGRHVNLLPLLMGLLQQWPDPRELQAQLATEASMLLPLGNDQWLRAPSERLRGIISTLLELYDRQALNKDGDLELSWYESLHLDSLLDTAGLKWQGADKLRVLSGKLRQFKGLTVVEPPAGFDATLRPYQQEGLNWLQFLREFGFQGILADDMGLGKTIQALAHLLIEKQSGRVKGPSLVVVPTSLVGNWRREASRFTPDLSVLVLHGADRQEDFSSIHEHDLVITTYALVRLDLEEHLKHLYHCIILDEAQNIKNPMSKTAQAAFQLRSEQRLALSGTPMENHLSELWSIFHFLMPGFLGPLQRFNRVFRYPIERQEDSLRQQELRRRVKPFLLRRTKQEVAKELPPKSEIIQYVSLEGPQRDLYETVRLSMDERLRAEIKARGLGGSQMLLLDALLKLRQICCDPRLLKLEDIPKLKSSAKLETLLDMVQGMVEEGRRILIFSQFVSMLNLIETSLRKAEIPTLRLTGETRNRDAVIQRFQAGAAPVFLISLKAGGVGLNLTAADTVIHYDPWWNPAAENQATDRAWRIGQDKPVFVYKMICERTVEEKILALQQRKLQLTSGIYSEQAEGEFNIGAEELLALLD